MNSLWGFGVGRSFGSISYTGHCFTVSLAMDHLDVDEAHLFLDLGVRW